MLLRVTGYIRGSCFPLENGGWKAREMEKQATISSCSSKIGQSRFNDGYAIRLSIVLFRKSRLRATNGTRDGREFWGTGNRETKWRQDTEGRGTSILITIYEVRANVRVVGCWKIEAILGRRRVSNFLIGPSFPVVYLMACS